MKPLKMLETFQEVGRETLLEGKIYKNLDGVLRQWLLENRKAVETDEEQPVHYGAQSEPELQHDDVLYEQMTKDTTGVAEIVEEAEADAEFEPLPELTEENAAEEKTAEPIMTTKNQSTTQAKKTKRGKK